MTRRVFFSFHYERDIWRVSQIRNSWVTKPDRDTAGFWDAVDWEKVKKQGDAAVHKWIDNQLKGTSVTVVLIGAETSKRDYVKYEIQKSCEIGNGLLGIYIHNMKDKDGNIDIQGNNPLDLFYMGEDEENFLSKIYPTYNWVHNDGYNNIGKWIEEAAKQANR